MVQCKRFFAMAIGMVHTRNQIASSLRSRWVQERLDAQVLLIHLKQLDFPALSVQVCNQARFSGQSCWSKRDALSRFVLDYDQRKAAG